MRIRLNVFIQKSKDSCRLQTIVISWTYNELFYFLFCKNESQFGSFFSIPCCAMSVRPQSIQCYSSSELRVGSWAFSTLVVCWLVNCSKIEEKMEL